MKLTKLRLLSTAVFVIGASLLATFFFKTDAYAAVPGTFKWIDANTIEADGYSLSGPIILKKEGSGTYTTSATITQKITDNGVVKQCTFNAVTIDFSYNSSGDNTQGYISARGTDEFAEANKAPGPCSRNEYMISGAITISNGQKGAKIQPSKHNFATADCTTFPPVDNNGVSSDTINQKYCGAVQQCIVNAGKNEQDCQGTLDRCEYLIIGVLTPLPQGATDQRCFDLVAQGNLDEANKALVDIKANANKTTCAVAAIGWIICPVVNVMASIVDGAYTFVEGLLKVAPITGQDSSKGIYDAWSIMRNFANVAFVIAFLIIIFSQVTSVGINNYGIKKMLPKLVVAAVLVNVSFWVCSIAVDLSNIIGGSLKGVFDSIHAQLPKPPNANDFGATANIWGALASSVLIATIGMYIQLSALLPMLVVALLAIVTVFLVLTLRQALIILLIVISPLAFVAYLLPNTESLFKKWRELFQVLLLMYPIIALLFGASALASIIVMGSADSVATNNGVVNTVLKVVIQIMGAGIAIVPLIITPILIKTTSGVLGKFGAFVNNPNKGPFDRMKKGAQGVSDRQKQRRQIAALNGSGSRRYRRQAKKQAIANSLNTNLNNAQAQYVAQQAMANPKFLNRLAGGTIGQSVSQSALNQALAGAINVKAKIEAEEVTAAQAVIKNMNLDRDQMRQLAEGGQVGGLDASQSRAVRAAAMKNVVDTGDNEGVNRLLDSMDGMSEDTRQDFADALAGSNMRPSYISQSALAGIRQGDAPVNPGTNTRDTDSTGRQLTISEQLAVNAINNNTYSVDKIASGDKDELDYVAKIAGSATITTNNANLKANAQTAKTDPRYSGKVSKNQASVDKLANL